MGEYQGLKFTTAKSMAKPVGRAPKGRKVEAPVTLLNWTANTLYDMSTQVQLYRRTKPFVDKIEQHLREGHGVLMVYQFMHQGHSKKFHDAFIGAVALNRTLAITCHNYRRDKPRFRPDPPHGWHIGDEEYRWFDPKDRTNWDLDNEKLEKKSTGKRRQGPKWEPAK